MKKHKIIHVFVPHKGCPHQCSFCNQRHITGQISETTPQTAREKIESYLATIDIEKNRVEVAFYGGSFTAIDENAQIGLLEIANEYKNQGKIHGIRLSTRPDCINVDVLRRLRAYGVTEIELGVQSMCDDVLTLNNRGHSAQDVVNAVSLIKYYGFTLGLQMMIGLIGDDIEKSVYTAEKIAELTPDFVRIYPTLVFKNTELHSKYLNGEYLPLDVSQAVNICVPVMRIFKQNNIKVIRLGLLVSDEEVKNNLVAGPYHPRFRELVEKRMS